MREYSIHIVTMILTHPRHKLLCILPDILNAVWMRENYTALSETLPLFIENVKHIAKLPNFYQIRLNIFAETDMAGSLDRVRRALRVKAQPITEMQRHYTIQMYS